MGNLNRIFFPGEASGGQVTVTRCPSAISRKGSLGRTLSGTTTSYNFSKGVGSETKLLTGLKLGCKGIITATTNVTGSLAREVYDNFINNLPQTSNQKLCDVRSTFEKYNLISGLHTLMSQKNPIFENLLPPLKLLSEKERQELLNDLKKFGFNLETLKAA